MLHPDQQLQRRAAFLLRRFPTHQSRVLELIEIDQQIAEINEEYTEVCTVLEEIEAEGKGTTPAASELRRLQSDLEEEIVEVLSRAGCSQ